jgi:hypothetical protein
VRKLTITVEESVYEGLRSRIGPRRISRFLNDLAKPLVTADARLEGYRAMARDRAREREALDWVESLIEDAADVGD